MIFGSGHPPLDPHRLAQRILSEHHFVTQQTPAKKTWWDVVSGWLSDRWSALLEAFAHHLRLSDNVSVTAGEVILLLTSALVLLMVIRLLSLYVREAPASPGATILQKAETPAALLSRSSDAARNARYAQGIALLFRAAVATLDAQGVVRDHPSLTVNECRMQVRDRAPRSLAGFDALAGLFTQARYADARVAVDQWNAARSAYADLSDGLRADG